MSKKRFYARKAKNNKAIAKERISSLFNEAKIVFSTDRSLSDRYVELARKLSMKYNVPLKSEQKKSFCKRCYSYLVPSVNSTVVPG